DSLHKTGCELIVVPAHTDAATILSYQPDGIFLSNGPGDPQDADYAITTIKQLLAEKPIFGICLGHQLLALALGAQTYKLKFGHRGSNHPVKDLTSGRVYITSQNHGYAVDENSIANLEVVVTHRAVNDGTIEGI
ncbi:glutamine amidotransferase-related protein, partial [Anaerospora hongkongensis]|uniref:glutamine amidotransferase-related protein n=1 Tax=Anaerospora hongkongensis TaxID=244830 RepID=UPI002FDA8261